MYTIRSNRHRDRDTRLLANACPFSITKLEANMIDDLKRYLIEFPRELSYRDYQVIKRNVYKAFFWTVTCEGKYLHELFEGIGENQIADLRDYKWVVNGNTEGKPFYSNVKATDYSHPKDQICGYTFKEGDPIYRCEECGYDETCVLCAHCFNEDDHLDHNISFYYSSANNEGMCDCGDPTAFVRNLRCACRKTLTIDSAFTEAISQVVKCIFKYALDVTNFSISTLPFIHRILDNDSFMSTRQLSDFSSLPVHEYGVLDENTGSSWYLVLWNDEYHNYDEARRAINAATSVSYETAENLARLISSSGRAVLKEAIEPTSLIPSQRAAERDGLICTIMSKRDYVREMIVAAAFSWVCAVTSFSGNSAFRDECKRQLSNVLLASNFIFSKSLSSEAFKGYTANLKQNFFECGLIVDGEREDLSPTAFNDLEAYSFDSSVLTFLKPLATKTPDSILQYLMLFEIRLPLSTRRLLRRIILTLLGGDRELKMLFAEQYLKLYPHLLITSALSDREDNLACMDHIRVQLFTCPKTNVKILNSGRLTRILAPLCWLIERYSSTFNESTQVINYDERALEARGKRDRSAIQRAIFSALNDLTHILSKVQFSTLSDSFPSLQEVYLLITLMKFYQGSSTIVRKLGDHVTHELLNDALLFLQKAIPIYYIVRCFTNLFPENSKSAATILKATLHLIWSHEKTFESDKTFVESYLVSSRPVSFINPINSFVSYLIQHCSSSELRQVFEGRERSFKYITEISLRSIVLAAQIRVGFWIRNGASVSREASYYTLISMREMSYFKNMHFIPSAGVLPLGEVAYLRDLHNLQIGFAFHELNLMFELFLKRWEIQDWFYGKVPSQETIYEDRFYYICEEMVTTLYHIFTNRSSFSFTTNNKSSQERIKRLCYSLCESPKSFSELVSDLDEDYSDIPAFEELLRTCATLQKPSGLTDSGMYRLKANYYDQLDPMSIFLESSKYEAVSCSLLKNLSRLSNISEDEIVLSPQIMYAEDSSLNDGLLRFYSSFFFAKLVYKLLRESVESEQEIFILKLLHLVHAVLIDIERDAENIRLLEAFISIPVCDLLLNVVESSMSSSVVRKADHLLMRFIELDPRVMKTLIDCFGEEHIQLYKKRKIGSASHEAEKRKTTAEKRKNKVFKKLAKQQKDFSARHGSSFAETISDEPPKRAARRCCVICGEQECSVQLFGILLCKSLSSTFWKIPPFHDVYNQLAFEDYGTHLPRNKEQVYSVGYPYKQMRERGLASKISAPVATSCCHGIHYKCYLRQQHSLQYVPCPLCHNLHDTFIPSFTPPLVSRMLDYWSDSTMDLKVAEPAVCEVNSLLLSKHLIGETYWAEYATPLKKLSHQIYQAVMRSLPNDDRRAENLSLQKIMISRLIADTIRANEIASRINGDAAYSNFLDDVSPQAKTTLLSLFQLRCYLSAFATNLPIQDPNVVARMPDLNNENSLFSQVIIKLLYGKDHPIDCIKWGYHNLLATLTFELVDGIKSRYPSAMKHHDTSRILQLEYNLLLSYVRSFLKDIWLPFEKTDADLMSVLAFVLKALQRISLTYLRQCALMWDILSSQQLEDLAYVSSAEIRDLKLKLQGSGSVELLDTLCKFFDIGSPIEVIKSIMYGGSDQNHTLDIFQHYDATKYEEDKSKLRTLIDFPGRISLLEMPHDYNSCLVDPVYKKKRPQPDSVCLTCGAYLSHKRLLLHPLECGVMPVYFVPDKNNLKVLVQIASASIEVMIPAPYLTAHGEVKKRGVPGKATLSQARYLHLNKLWLNQGLFGFATRSLFDSRRPQIFRPDLQVFEDDFFEDDIEDFNDDVDAFDPD